MRMPPLPNLVGVVVSTVAWSAPCLAGGPTAPATPIAPAAAEERHEATSSPPPPMPSSRRNVVFLELLGNGGLYSINYERLLTDDVSVRAGLSAFDCESSGLVRLRYAAVTSPLLASYYLGGRENKLQIGGGVTIVYSFGDEPGLGAFGTAVVGYRYLPSDGGFTFGIGFTPLVSTTGEISPLVAVSGGARF